MDKGVQGWIYRQAKKHYWRVSSWYDFDDLVQDGFLCYYRIHARYAANVPGERRIGTAKEKRHIMSLFQSSYINHIHDLARSKQRQLDLPTFDGELRSSAPDAGSETERLISEAPPLVARVIRALMHDDTGALLKPFPHKSDGTRETVNERLCALVGLNPALAPQLRTAIRNYLTA